MLDLGKVATLVVVIILWAAVTSPVWTILYWLGKERDRDVDRHRNP